jgi:hypothetical protein
MIENRSRETVKLLVVIILFGLVPGVARAQAPAAPAVAAAPAASKPASPKAASSDNGDKVVLKVGDQQFTKSDIDLLVQSLGPQAQRALATQGKKPLGDQFALVIMLSQQARLHHLDQSPEFVHKLAFQKDQLEAQEEINQQSKVTPEEVQKYYSDHAATYDEITVRQIVVRKKAAPAQPAAGTPPPAPNGPGLTPEEAKTKADAIRKELLAGTDIKKLMDDFKAPGDIVIEAEPRKVRRGGMRPEMESVAFALKDGEISEPVDVPQAVVIFQVTAHGHADLKDIAPEIEKSLRQQKIDATLADVKKKNTVWMDDQYFAPPARLSDVPSLNGPAAKPAQKP